MVVRRIVPGETGPTGGPAFTDVLGTCTAWGDVVVIDSADGPVSIPVGAIVSGKPVPPRPSVLRRIPPRDAELHTARLWPTVVTEALGAWQLRLETRPEGRLLKRANSCLAMGDPGMPVAEALRRVETFYAPRGRQPLVQVELGSAVETEARAAGWETISAQTPGAPVTAHGFGDAAFLAGSLAQVERRLREAARTAGPARLREDGGRAVAEITDAAGVRIGRGAAVLDGDWLAVHDLVVEPEHRGRGVATALLRELVSWAAERGGRTVWLHVELSNGPARGLYERAGLIEHHRCRYLTPAA